MTNQSLAEQNARAAYRYDHVYLPLLKARQNRLRHVSRTSPDAVSDDIGWQISPLMARLTGHVKGLKTMFNRCGWQMSGDGPSRLYVLTAEKYQLTEA